MTGISYPNTVTSTLSYEALTGRLANLTHSRGLTDLADFAYGYDAIGKIASIAELTQTRDFTYDLLQRLTAGGTAATPETYAYDPEGNRTASHLSGLHVTDIANRLTEDDGFCYVYDLNGNLASKTAKAGGAVTFYTYDAQDQLTRIDFPDLTTAAYRYDGLGRRIEKDANASITRYVYDGSDILLEFDGTGTLLARYSHGQRTDQPLAVTRGGQEFFYHADHQGSIRKITDAAGLAVNSYDYDAYGNIEASFEGIANPFTYTGRELDAETGLYYYRARYYDSETGRFLSEDQLDFAAGDLNLYRYVSNNPVNFVDPFGLDTLVIDNGPLPLSVSNLDIGNPFGHSSVAVTGSGVYSFGNNEDSPINSYTGTSVTEYLADQSTQRDTQVFIIPTTPEQEQQILDYLKGIDTIPNMLPDNCTGRTVDALEAGGVNLEDPFLLGMTPIPFPASLQRSLQNLVNQGGATSIIIPQGGPVPPGLEVFNPTSNN